MKTLVVLLSHVFNDFVVDRYRDLEMSLIDNHDLVLAHPNECDESFFIDNNINHLKITQPEVLLDPKNSNHPNLGKLFLDMFNRKQEYDYFWIVEYDLTVNSDKPDKFSNIFLYFANESYDIVCDHFHSYESNFFYNYRYSFDHITETYPEYGKLNLHKEDIRFGFYTICRLSKNLFLTYKDNPLYQELFFEIGLTTLAHKNNLSICSLENLFTTTDDPYVYRVKDNVNIGSNGWRLKKWEMIKLYPEGCIVHPLKSYS